MNSCRRLLGVLEARLGDAPAAAEALRRAVELGPGDRVSVQVYYFCTFSFAIFANKSSVESILSFCNKSLEALQRLKVEGRGEPAALARAEKIAGNAALRESPSRALAPLHKTTNNRYYD